MAKNKVIAGDYNNCSVIKSLGFISINSGFKQLIQLDQTTVESYEVVTEEQNARKSGTQLVSIEFKDGKKSLIEIDDKIYKELVVKMFKTSPSSISENKNANIPKKKKKGCLPIGCLIFVIFFVAVPIIFISQNPEKYNTDSKSKLVRELDITGEQGENVIKTLASVGINEDISIKHDEGLDNAHFEGEKGYRLSNGETSNIILYMNGGEVHNIRYADNDMYKEGKVISKINDYIVTISEKSALQVKCKESLKTILKSPSTAKFAGVGDWKVWKENGQTIVQSYVDSQNGFGAMVRSEFQFIIENDNIVSLIIDGKEYMK
ncbi:hypothetical protein [Lysinibacillus pakistanensis]|uniref:hypothetical protein n=1 Tax=Lysinibacillus pakistanensis TaxID=759811 RepID=UPI003D27A790